MSKNRKRRKKTVVSSSHQADWPSWFIEPTHPVEQEMLIRALQSNKQLSDIHFTVQMVQVNYILFRKNYEELVKLQKEFDHPLIFRELAFQTDQGKVIAQDTIIEFTRLLHNFLAA